MTALEVLRLPDHASRSDLEVTRVTFAQLSDAEIDAYVATREPFDKAGGYAIQGRAGCFITRVDGCFFNVVGLPLARLCRILRDLGWSHG
jgi:septum formation protein